MSSTTTITKSTSLKSLKSEKNIESSKSISLKKNIKSGAKASAGVSSNESQKLRIWEWGVDETLWNPTKTRYAGRLPPLVTDSDDDDGDDDDDDDFTEEQEDEWIRLSFTMTDEEREQNERAMAAFREHLEPPSDEVVEEMLDLLGC